MSKNQKTRRRKRPFAWTLGSGLLLGALTLLVQSCADHYDGDESWSPQVTNSTLASPDATQISVAPSADGSTMTIAWPVVYGAGGYSVALYNVNDPLSPLLVKSDTIDGCSFSVGREEDTNYSLTVRTLGNQKYNNQTATEGTEFKFTTFLPSYAEIPEGDLKAWFEANPIPADSASHLCFDLVPGGSYTMSGKIDLGGHQVTLRSKSKASNANIVMGAGSYFNTYAGFTLKYLNINAEATDKPLITFSDEPGENIKDLIADKGYYFIMDPVVVQGCKIEKLGSCIMSSNGPKYDVRVVSINNTVVELDKTLPTAGNHDSGTSSAAVIYMKTGFITDFTIKNSTVYSKERTECFFIHHGGRPKDISKEEQRYTSILNCTLANIAYNKNFCDYHNGQTTYHYALKNTIIVDCGKQNFLAGLNKGQANDFPTWDVNNNTCWRDGEDASASQTGIKNPGVWLTTDPEINPAAEDFVPAAAQQEAGQGDPRWNNQ